MAKSIGGATGTAGAIGGGTVWAGTATVAGAGVGTVATTGMAVGAATARPGGVADGRTAMPLRSNSPMRVMNAATSAGMAAVIAATCSHFASPLIR